MFEELNGILFYPVQYEGEESERNVFYTGAAPNQQAIPAVDYLMNEEKASSAGCSPAPTTSIRARPTRSSRPTSRRKGVASRGHHDQLHAVRPLRLADDRRRHQEVRLGRQEDRRRLDHQRRRQRAVLQGARQPGHQGRRTSRSSRSRSARRSSPASTPSRWSATSPPGTTSSRSTRRRTTTFIDEVARLHQERQARHQRPDGGARTSASTCG